MTRRWIVVMSLASASLGTVGATRLAHAGACVGTTCSCDDECNAPFTCVDGSCCNFGPDSVAGTPCARGAGGGPSGDDQGAGGSNTTDLVAPSSAGTSNGGNGGMPAVTTPSPSASAGASDSSANSDADDDDAGCSFAAPDNRKPTRVGWGLLAGLLGSALFARRRGSSLRRFVASNPCPSNIV